MGNLCFGKCDVMHYSLWGVQTINFPYSYATRNVQMQLKSTVASRFGSIQRVEIVCVCMCVGVGGGGWLVAQ